MSAPSAGPTSTCSATSTTWCTSTTSRRRGSTCCAPTRPDQRADELAEGVVVVRHEVYLPGPADVPLPPGQHRVLGHRGPRGQLHHGLRDLRRGRGRRAHDVYVRARTVLTPYVFATERPRRLTPTRRTSSRRSSSRRAARQPADRPGRGAGAGPLPAPRAVLRRRRLRPRQQREVLRVLPGGAHPADARPRRARCPAPASPRRGRPDRRRLQGADPVPARAVRRAGRWITHVGDAVVHRSSRRSATASRCSPGPGSCSSSSTRRRALGRPGRRSTARRCWPPCRPEPPASGSLQGVDHELRGVGDVVPELRVLLGRQLGLRPGRPGSAPASARAACGVTANGACRIRSRGWPRCSE